MKKYIVVLITISIICSVISCSNNVSSESESNTNIIPTLTNTVVSTSTAEESMTVVPTIQASPLPEYLDLVIPEPGVYSLAEYNNQAISAGWGADRPGICFLFGRSIPFLEDGDILTTEEMLNRISLAVNDTELNEYQSINISDLEGWDKTDPDTGQIIWRTPDGIPYEICYVAILEAGFYEATISVERTTLDPITYTWSFLIEP